MYGGDHVTSATGFERLRYRHGRRVLFEGLRDRARQAPAGFANFAISDPPLKLVLIEDSSTRGHGTVGALNHLGVEVEGSEDVGSAAGRLRRMGFETHVQEQTTCCFAVQDKVWVNDPDGAPWEFYTVLADAPATTGIAGDDLLL